MSIKPQLPGLQGIPLARATEIIQNLMGESGESETADRPQTIKRLIEKYQISVPDLNAVQLARTVHDYAYGLDILESIYHDPAIDEIRVNGPHYISVQRHGRNEQTDLRFKDDEHVYKIARRLISHDRAMLTRATPQVESVRPDGARITATLPPLTAHPTLVIRKHGTRALSAAELIELGTLCHRGAAMLEALVRARAGIIISGATATGKTSLLRLLVRYLEAHLRIVSMETDRELRLAAAYPDRDIVEFEEHADLGQPLDQIFRTVLRYTPDITIVGEVRGRGEADQMVNAALRGHEGTLSTVHVTDARLVPQRLAMMRMREGNGLPIAYLEREVAQAFDVIVQMRADTALGTKKVIGITELTPGSAGAEFRDLYCWRPADRDYWTGEWAAVGAPGARLQHKFAIYGVPPAVLARAGWAR